MNKYLGIKAKLIAGFAVVSALSIVIALFSLYQINLIASPLQKEIPESEKEIQEASRLDSLAQFIRY